VRQVPQNAKQKIGLNSRFFVLFIIKMSGGTSLLKLVLKFMGNFSANSSATFSRKSGAKSRELIKN